MANDDGCVPEVKRVCWPSQAKDLNRIQTCHDSRPILLPRCYQAIPNQADLSDTTSVPSVEIFELTSSWTSADMLCRFLLISGSKVGCVVHRRRRTLPT